MLTLIVSFDILLDTVLDFSSMGTYSQRLVMRR